MRTLGIAALALLLFSSCKTTKLVRLLRSGETQTAEESFLAEVPFEDNMGLVMIPVKIEGKTFRFILDTGAPNVISMETAEAIGAKKHLSQSTGDSQGVKNDLDFAYLPDIEIGGIVFHHTGGAIADLKQSHEVGCLSADGLLGANLMRQAFWEIDFTTHKVRIASSLALLEVPSDAPKLSFKTVLSGTPKVSVYYEGVEDKNVTVDFGSRGYFSTSDKTIEQIENYEELPSFSGYGARSSGLYGTGENDTTHVIRIPEVRVGDIVLNEQAIEYDAHRARTIGTEFFRHYRTVIDWEEEVIYFIPHSTPDKHDFEAFGFSPVFSDDVLKVGYIIPTSEAAMNGMAVGDQILSINNLDFAGMTIEKYCVLLQEDLLRRSDVLTVHYIHDGVKHTVELSKQNFLE